MKPATPLSSAAIAERIIDALMAQRLSPGARLGEQQLADLFGVSRTLVREAMMRLAARGVVQVNARRGWFVVHPTPDEVRAAFEARRVIETGLLREASATLSRAGLQRLRDHIGEERAALRQGDVNRRSWLLGDFHVCLAEAMGNAVLADILRDLTARTQLMAMLYQSDTEAHDSCDDHAEIVAALAAGDTECAVTLMREHLNDICRELDTASPNDALDAMRSALAPVRHAADQPRRRRARKVDAAAAAIAATEPANPAAPTDSSNPA